MNIRDALEYMDGARFANYSGQIVQQDRDGKDVEILCELSCSCCSEVRDGNADELGEALVTILNSVVVSRVADQTRGLYQKYEVRRLDDPTGKHAACPFFVLDIRHDPHARAALRAYIESCRAEYPQLADDLEGLLSLDRVAREQMRRGQ